MFKNNGRKFQKAGNEENRKILGSVRKW